MRQIKLTWNVSHLTPYSVPVTLSGSLFAPDEAIATERPVDLLVCLHGGSCCGEYYHPSYLDPSYSFARFMTDRGYLVLALDTLGMGNSSKPEPEKQLTLEVIAAASDFAARQAAAALQDGEWLQLPPHSKLRVSGLGHSMGGMLSVYQQGRFKSFERLIVAGWSNLPLDLGDTDAASVQASLSDGGYIPTDRQAMRGFFHLPDVPEDLIARDDQHAGLTPVTLALAALTPGAVENEAGAIDCPVLLLYGEVDVSPDPQRETSFYPHASDRTITLIGHAAHMHNMASSRLQVWQTMDTWLQAH
ncbi:MAG TPA: alpha/beta hydrolase [Pseudomonas xinjiangensis]|uniref:Alpha/beta hydrolase n=2 Tax=root TaxID=1 RepID=A0A7V1FS82_9GAMM|nr:alpha/beta hydrolase [Halopseudomonas xinjiangensis]HEC48104.1 alpha/beta hydrolase [Halopseudomonas xinjiangensis]